MRRFIQRSLDKLPKMDVAQIRGLIVSLAQENDLLVMLLESMTDGIIVTDREHRVSFYNKAAERMFPCTTGNSVTRGGVTPAEGLINTVTSRWSLSRWPASIATSSPP